MEGRVTKSDDRRVQVVMKVNDAGQTKDKQIAQSNKSDWDEVPEGMCDFPKVTNLVSSRIINSTWVS